MTRRGRAAVATVGLMAAIAAAAFTLQPTDPRATTEADAAPDATAAVTRRDLITREDVDGTLGFADERALLATGSGTLTWLPDEGSTVRRGGRLFRVDDDAVRLLYGRVPAWRTMTEGDEGIDVEQLERNLAAMGYTDGGEMDVDGDFDDDTADAVEYWQEDVGAEEDGTVDLSEIVFLDGARRIGSHEAAVGSQVSSGTTVMTTASTRQVVAVDLDASSQELARRGDLVEVELPDGRTVRGRISHVGAIAETGDTGEGEEEADPTIEVLISLKDRAAGGLDEAPVTVGLASQVARDVLAVPVEALLALAEGGYALEVVEGGSTRLVGVETGLYADGWVEISGDGMAEGSRVVIAS